MRRFLNLNQPGILFVKLIGLFMVIIPVVFYIILLVFRLTGTSRTILFDGIKISFGFGGLIFVVFLILVALEQIQDHYLDLQFQRQQGQKILLNNRNYECQFCGNQNVRENDKMCNVCGKEFAIARKK